MTQRRKSQGRMLYPGVVLYGGDLIMVSPRGGRQPVPHLSSRLVDKPVDRKKKSVASLHKRTV